MELDHLLIISTSRLFFSGDSPQVPPFTQNATVAALLRGLWTIAPWAEGHTRIVVNKLKTRLKNFLKTFSASIVFWGYVVVTYPPCAYICSPCKRYVVVTYRSIKCSSCKKRVSDMFRSGELILTGRSSYGANGYSFTSPLYFYIIFRCYFIYLIELIIVEINLSLTCAVSNLFLLTVLTSF